MNINTPDNCPDGYPGAMAFQHADGTCSSGKPGEADVGTGKIIIQIDTGDENKKHPHIFIKIS